MTQLSPPTGCPWLSWLGFPLANVHRVNWFWGSDRAMACELYLPYLAVCCHDRSTMFHPLLALPLVHMGKARKEPSLFLA